MRTTCTAIAALMLVAAPGFAAEEADKDGMRSLTSGFLASLSKEKAAASSEAAKPDLTTLIQQAVAVGESDAYLEALMNEAIEKGEVEVTDGMRNTEGDVDTRVLLASLVSKSSDQAEPAVQSTFEEPLEDRYYVVKSGDSLAAIALAFYDTTTEYNRIFEANRDTLKSPNLIQVGQSLLIPHL